MVGAGHHCALTVYDRLPVSGAVMVEPAPGGDREDELYARLEERLQSGKRERAPLRAYGVVAVHRPGRITHLFDAFVSRIESYFDGYPPSNDIASTDQPLSPRVPPLYAALSISYGLMLM